ncbi:heme-binding protein [Streptomyces sp. NPDC004393]
MPPRSLATGLSPGLDQRRVSVPRAGGVLVTDGELVLGAAGASGAHAAEDEEAVQTALQRWQKSRSTGGQE